MEFLKEKALKGELKMINSKAYQIVMDFVKNNKNLYETGKDFGMSCYDCNAELRKLIAESTACSYACSCMIELGIRDKREKVVDEVSFEVTHQKRRQTKHIKIEEGYAEKEVIDLLDGIEYLGKGLYSSIKHNNRVAGRGWNPLDLIEMNKTLLKDYQMVIDQVDIEKLYNI